MNGGSAITSALEDQNHDTGLFWKEETSRVPCVKITGQETLFPENLMGEMKSAQK